jgi:hypothetical protein
MGKQLKLLPSKALLRQAIGCKRVEQYSCYLTRSGTAVKACNHCHNSMQASCIAKSHAESHAARLSLAVFYMCGAPAAAAAARDSLRNVPASCKTHMSFQGLQDAMYIHGVTSLRSQDSNPPRKFPIPECTSVYSRVGMDWEDPPSLTSSDPTIEFRVVLWVDFNQTMAR